jgi:DNA ligase-1
MNSDAIYAAIEEVAATSSKNAKESLVKKGAEHPEFVRVLKYAYDPFYVYGVASRTLRVAARMADPADQPGHFNEGTWALLDNLIAQRVTGDAATQAIADELGRLTLGSSQLLGRILLKDLRAGFSESTSNKAVPGLIPEFPYMRCSLPEKSNMPKWQWAKGYISQEKADGSFANVDVGAGKGVSISTRQGTPYPVGCMPELEAAIAATLMPSTQTHGELVVYRMLPDPDMPGVHSYQLLPREEGNGILSSLAKGGELAEGDMVKFQCWDQIPRAEAKPKGKYKVPYVTRLRALIEQVKAVPAETRLIEITPTKVVKSLDEAVKHCRDLMRLKKEGTVLKDPDAWWIDGTSKDQVKLKGKVDVDLRVVAIVPGAANTKNEGRAGSLTVETSCGQLRTDVAVKNEAMRDAVDANPDDWLNRIIVVRANCIMTPGPSNPMHSLFLPRMVEAGYRTDKTEADDLERVKDQFENAVEVL